MAVYSRAQIEVMARAAGWGSASRDASYVAMAESSGDASAVNSIGATGLMQILQPVHVKAHPTWTTAWLKNPINNLTAGRILYKAAGSKFDGPWLDSRDKGAGGGWGAHVKGSGSSSSADQAGFDPWAGDEVAGALGDVPGLQGVADIASFTAKAGNWISNPANWIRILYVAGGAALVITGLTVIASNTRAGQIVAGATRKIATKGMA